MAVGLEDRGMNENEGSSSQLSESLVDNDTRNDNPASLESEPNINDDDECISSDESSHDSVTTNTPNLNFFIKDLADWDSEDVAAWLSWLRKEYLLLIDVDEFPLDGKALLAVRAEDLANRAGLKDDQQRLFVALLEWSKANRPVYPDKITKRKPLHKNQVDCQVSGKWCGEKLLNLINIHLKDKWKLLSIIVGMLAAMFMSLTYYYNLSYFGTLVNSSFNKTYLQQEISKRYPSQSIKMLKVFFLAIDDVNNGENESDISAVITMLYSHQETAHCLANDFAKYAALIFNRGHQFEHLDGLSLGENFSLGCNDLKNSIIRSGILVVYNFQNISADKVKLFHGICDKETPFVKSKAVYIILLEIGPNQQNASKTMEKVYLRMTELWSSLERPILDPLITRLSVNIVDVKKEKNPPSC